jgi:transposase InsO family protein
MGPFPRSRGGRLYICIFLDDYTNHVTLDLLSTKADVANSFKTYFNAVQTLFHHQIKFVRSDNGGEYVKEVLERFFEEKGIQHEFKAPYTPEQNGKAERKNRLLIEKVRCLLHQARLPIEFWGEAVATFFLANIISLKITSQDKAKTNPISPIKKASKCVSNEADHFLNIRAQKVAKQSDQWEGANNKKKQKLTI